MKKLLWNSRPKPFTGSLNGIDDQAALRQFVKDYAEYYSAEKKCDKILLYYLGFGLAAGVFGAYLGHVQNDTEASRKLGRSIGFDRCLVGGFCPPYGGYLAYKQFQSEKGIFHCESIFDDQGRETVTWRHV